MNWRVRVVPEHSSSSFTSYVSTLALAVGLLCDYNLVLFRLRPQSAEDARKAGELARNLDVDHRVLTVNWEGPPPSRSAVQNPARNHRYKLLLDMCGEHSITTLMMGHHVDDQIGKVVAR